MEKTLNSQQHNTPEDNSVQPATGLFLIFPTLFIHFLEVTNSAMKSIVEDLNESINNRNGLIREASILNISYNVELFPCTTILNCRISANLDSNTTLSELVI